MIGADRRPGILARMLGSMLQKAREVAGLSYDEAAARLSCEADWLVRVETGFAVADADAVERILVGYGVREAKVADTMIDMARRAAAPPPWLAPHTSRMSAANRDVLLVEAEATLAQLHGFRLIPWLLQTEAYFREIAPGAFFGKDPDPEWELLAARQAHRPAGVTRLLDVMIDESALDVRMKGGPGVMAEQISRLIEVAGSPHATVRVIPWDAKFWEQRGHNFEILSFAGTEDRIGVCHYPVLGAELAHSDLYEPWSLIEEHAAADVEQSREILERRLAGLSGGVGGVAS